MKLQKFLGSGLRKWGSEITFFYTKKSIRFFLHIFIQQTFDKHVVCEWIFSHPPQPFGRSADGHVSSSFREWLVRFFEDGLAVRPELLDQSRDQVQVALAEVPPVCVKGVCESPLGLS